MAEQLTQEQAIESCKLAHNGFYTYARAVYTKSTEKFTVTCPLHGDFRVSFTNHTHAGKPRGCPKCGVNSRAEKRTLPQSAFLEQARVVHTDRYDYSRVEYKNRHTKVEIVCKDHGSFWQTPEKHIANRNCPECAGNGKMSTERFIRSAIKTHGDKFDYSQVNDSYFVGEAPQVPIGCKVHGVFMQRYSNHLTGMGCRKCSRNGFNTSKKGAFYVLSDGSNVKVGITNRPLKTRVKEINKPTGNFSIIKNYTFYSGAECALVETKMLRWLRANYKNTEGNFDGVSESFQNVDVSLVLNKIKELLENG